MLALVAPDGVGGVKGCSCLAILTALSISVSDSPVEYGRLVSTLS